MSIIAILAALGLTAMQGGRKRSLHAQVEQQLRNLDRAVAGYIGDNDGTFPGSQHSGNSWVGGLLPYFCLGIDARMEEMQKFHRSPGDPKKDRREHGGDALRY